MTDIKAATDDTALFAPNATENLHIHNRVDFDIIASLVRPGTRVLDVGCSDGELLQLLRDTRNVTGAVLNCRKAVLISALCAACR